MPSQRFELEDAELTALNHVMSTLAERDDFETLVPHPADQQAIHNLVALLEREDPVVFAADYHERLGQARHRILPDELPD